MKSRFAKIKIGVLLAAIFFVLFLGQFAKAQNFSDITNFYVDKNFDISQRTQISAVLVKTSRNLYFYVDKSWWDQQVPAKKDEISASLDKLSAEFDGHIYSVLTSVFGSEWKPGVDNDNKIAVLFEPMNANEGGYFRSADEYVKIQVPDSNEREMVYLATDYIDDPQAKVILAHEFVHLITFNQKEKIMGVEEEVWLNEARADYSSTILGYDDQYEGSNLQRRVKDFVQNPSDSITEWKGAKYDYASLSMFMHYMVDHYSITVLSDSIKLKSTGIDSINSVLSKTGYKEDFAKIFTNWTIAVAVNNCSLGDNYCYLNKNLANFKLVSTLNFLPLQGSASLSVSDVTKNWAGNWLKFIGGNGDLKLDFSSLAGLNFQLPYIVEDSAGSQQIKFLALDKDEKGQIDVKKFGTDYKSLIIIPSLQSKTSDFSDMEPTYPFTYTVSVAGEQSVEEQTMIQKLLDQIAYLKSEIARLQSGNNGSANQGSCSQLNNNLSFGMSNNDDVRCLQEFFKGQGSTVYPEGLITGNFGILTRQAVIRFQEKYKAEILTPLGLASGTGFVGPATRAKINQILNGG